MTVLVKTLVRVNIAEIEIRNLSNLFVIGLPMVLYR
jgi:hypothetical protein